MHCAVNLHVALFPGHFTSGWEGPVKLVPRCQVDKCDLHITYVRAKTRVGVKGKHGASYSSKYSIVIAVHP